jgi:hypothetical protein
MNTLRSFLVISVGAAALAGAAAAANPVHLTGDFTFPDAVCGIPVQHEVSFIDNFGASKQDGSSYDAGQVVETFTAANGRGVRITFDAGREANAPPTTNADGTTTQVDTFSGLDAKTQAVDGPVLEQGAGRVAVAFVSAADGHVLSISVASLAGQNPNLTGAPDCAVIAPYLS